MNIKETVETEGRGNGEGTRLIDWSRGNNKGNPKIWREEDYEELANAYELFARKFSSEEDYNIIEKVRNMVRSRAQQ